MAYDWNQEHCKPSLDDNEFERQWNCAIEFIEKNGFVNDENLIIIEENENENEPITSQDIKFVLDTISKQAPYDKIQIKQIFYGICSSQTSTKIHHNINSKKSGEGKSYNLKLVYDLFPDSIILKFNNMSDKALYHQQGFEAVKNENTGQYEELKPILKQLELEIEELEEKIEETNNKQLKKSLKSQKKDIETKDHKSQVKNSKDN